MSSRVELHDKFVSILGNRNVYFQPPETVKLTYPCIIYSLSNIDTHKADDITYFKKKQYDIQVIDRDAESEIPDKLLELPYCSFDRQFTSSNLYHFNLTIFY